MTTLQIEHILDAHCVPHYEKDGHIYADSMDAAKNLFEEVEDVTNWTKSRLAAWLGY